MKRFLVNLNIIVNNKKISAIRLLRGAVGIGLLPAKIFVETRVLGYADSYGGDLICNSDQVAALLMLTMSSYSWDEPNFSISSISLITEKGLDISNLT